MRPISKAAPRSLPTRTRRATRRPRRRPNRRANRSPIRSPKPNPNPRPPPERYYELAGPARPGLFYFRRREKAFRVGSAQALLHHGADLDTPHHHALGVEGDLRRAGPVALAA